MNLKESFRYQNYLESLFNEAVACLVNRRGITTTTNEHMRSKANPEAMDEVLTVEYERPYSCSNDQLIEFMCAIVVERRDVAIAIHQAKAYAAFACDAEVASNRCVQTAAKTLAALGSMKSSTERTYKGTDYKFNAEGNQVPYSYDIKETVVVDFDQKAAKEKSRELFQQADHTSTEADKFLIETTVNHQPKYNVNEGFDDAISRFLTFGQ